MKSKVPGILMYVKDYRFTAHWFLEMMDPIILLTLEQFDPIFRG